MGGKSLKCHNQRTGIAFEIPSQCRAFCHLPKGVHEMPFYPSPEGLCSPEHF